MERDNIDFEVFRWPSEIKILKRTYTVTKIVPWKTLEMRTAERFTQFMFFCCCSFTQYGPDYLNKQLLKLI